MVSLTYQTTDISFYIIFDIRLDLLEMTETGPGGHPMRVRDGPRDTDLGIYDPLIESLSHLWQVAVVNKVGDEGAVVCGNMYLP